MDVIRKLLLWMEEQDNDHFIYGHFPPMPDQDTTDAHIHMLESVGFLTKPAKNQYRISWEGYEFLDKVRDPEIWKKTKEGASKLGSWSVRLLGEIASGYIKLKADEIGIPIT